MAEIMSEHIVERAIIMAAGIGQRLRPVTLTTPKPLVTVNGVCMIDTIIAALHENEIHEIYVVVGYLKEQFYEWAKKYNGITLIENPWYAECNNIASLYVAREYLNNAIILDGDQIIRNPAILHREFTRSGYSCAWTDRATNEWLLTVKNGIVTKCSHTGGDHGWGLAGTFTSFIILGNYGLAQQLKHGLDITGFVAAGGDYSEAIMKIFDTLPLTEVGLILLAVTMIAFYSTTFDALTMVVSSYSYKRLKPEQEPDKRVRTFWAVVFILLPIALIFSENSMHSLQSVSIIAAFPIGIIILIIVASFFRDASGYLQERKDTQA